MPSGSRSRSSDTASLESSRTGLCGSCPTSGFVMMGWVIAIKSSLPGRSCATANDRTVDRKQNNGTDHGGDDAGAVTDLVPAEGVTQHSGDERTRNSEENGDDRAARIPVSYTHLRAHETDSYLVCR